MLVLLFTTQTMVVAVVLVFTAVPLHMNCLCFSISLLHTFVFHIAGVVVYHFIVIPGVLIFTAVFLHIHCFCFHYFTYFSISHCLFITFIIHLVEVEFIFCNCCCCLTLKQVLLLLWSALLHRITLTYICMLHCV